VRKPAHPGWTLARRVFGADQMGFTQNEVTRVVVKQVKPLLAALRSEHESLGSEVGWHRHNDETCDVCCLLREWEANP